MSSWINQHRTILFIAYVLLWLILYSLFGTNLINYNVKRYMFNNLPTWLNIIAILIPILILIYLWPRKTKA